MSDNSLLAINTTENGRFFMNKKFKQLNVQMMIITGAQHTQILSYFWKRCWAFEQINERMNLTLLTESRSMMCGIFFSGIRALVHFTSTRRGRKCAISNIYYTQRCQPIGWCAVGGADISNWRRSIIWFPLVLYWKDFWNYIQYEIYNKATNHLGHEFFVYA